MSTKDIYNKRVIFEMQNGLEVKRDRLIVMMSKLAANDEGTNKQFKPKIFQSKRSQMRISITNIIMIKETIRIGIE